MVLERVGEWAIVKISNYEESGVKEGSVLSAINNVAVVTSPYEEIVSQLQEWYVLYVQNISYRLFLITFPHILYNILDTVCAAEMFPVYYIYVPIYYFETINSNNELTTKSTYRMYMYMSIK